LYTKDKSKLNIVKLTLLLFFLNSTTLPYLLYTVFSFSYTTICTILIVYTIIPFVGEMSSLSPCSFAGLRYVSNEV